MVFVMIFIGVGCFFGFVFWLVWMLIWYRAYFLSVFVWMGLGSLGLFLVLVSFLICKVKSFVVVILNFVRMGFGIRLLKIKDMGIFNLMVCLIGK